LMFDSSSFFKSQSGLSSFLFSLSSAKCVALDHAVIHHSWWIDFLSSPLRKTCMCKSQRQGACHGSPVFHS
jgi:hypothetical protein